jgi:LacI family transcriptional regulator
VEGLNNLGYFGQDARQSGLVSAKLMDLSLPREANILIVKQTNNKIFSRHIEARVEGLLDYFAQIPDRHRIHPIIVEIDLLDPSEPEKSFLAACKSVGTIDGIYIPNSRTFRLAESFNKMDLSKSIIIGYDLLDQNIELLKQGKISCLINQKPEEQSYRAILAMFHFLASGKKTDKTNYSPIDIIVKENVDYYI